ncbi:transporter substrate-binding domain-containing protein [Paraglaciecola aquimarina]|uniref:Transporter substrate-binding domain-containing protein n=1 Tax=Paraglaciecola algarum TaxID=3050085 RepID=A0ABS9D606_9ALTE|nr:transporter substrate-binding domain-containing protein [Paraglaciecola sp. G1-23]MCF2947867.1 transporter substrate-binding domain-containing protein [Paraglaciecola sp. G1-23]
MINVTKIKAWLSLMIFSAAWIVISPAVIASENKKYHIIKYPKVIDTNLYQNQSNYFVDVLKLALDKTGINYKIEFVNIPSLAQSRSQSLIKQGVYDIHWLTTSEERESALKPIRIPLYRGLLGLRIAFINKTNQDLFANTHNLADLSQFYSGQGRDWVDTKILNFNRLKLMLASTSPALFDMLRINRIDYVPRSILEIWWETELAETSGLAVDPYIALHYPEPVYFFVRNDKTDLHEYVFKGLNIAINDGSFQKIFNQYFGEYIKKSQLDKRRIFNLINPYLPTKTPLNDSRLWHQLSTGN